MERENKHMEDRPRERSMHTLTLQLQRFESSLPEIMKRVKEGNWF